VFVDAAQPEVQGVDGDVAGARSRQRSVSSIKPSVPRSSRTAQPSRPIDAECPHYPGKRYEDWPLDDPAGKTIEDVRPIRDEIRRRVEMLLGSLALDA